MQTARELALARKCFGHFQDRFEDLGKSLDKAQQAYHTASGHLSQYQSRIPRLTGDGVAEGDVKGVVDAGAQPALPLTEGGVAE